MSIFLIYIIFKYIYIYITCPTCPDSGGQRVHVGHSNLHVLRVPCPVSPCQVT